MAAYVIIDIEVFDQESFSQYQAQAGPVMERYGGKFLVHAGSHQVVEGDWKPSRLSIMEFENAGRAMEFYHSPEYTAFRPSGQGSARTRIIVLEGLKPS